MTCLECAKKDQKIQELMVLVAPDKNQLGPFVKSSSTSRQAAVKSYPNSGAKRFRIFKLIASWGGFGGTREEIGDKLNMNDNTVRPRVKELIDHGFVSEPGATKKTRSGCQAKIVTLSPQGRIWYQAYRTSNGP